ERVHRVRIAASGPWKLRRIDRMAVCKAGDESAVGGKPPRPVQADERPAGAADLDLGLDSSPPKAEPSYLRGGHGHSPASSAEAAAKAAAGCLDLRRSGHQRSSYLSSHRSARCGSTSRANRSMFFLHSAVAMEPKCRSASRWPIRKRLMPSMSCSRTVFGLPTTTKPRPNKSLALSSRRLMLARGLWRSDCTSASYSRQPGIAW